MNNKRFKKSAWLVCIGCFFITVTHASEAVWHCSKTSSDLRIETDDFGVGTAASGNQTLLVTLGDLLATYSGYPVRVSGRPLFACFMPAKEAMSLQALKSLDLSASALQVLARRSAIVQRQLEIVTDEAGMQRCMIRNAPAFGYLSVGLNHEKFAPCF